MIRLGVTGTDTGAGKTVIAVALVALLRSRGLRVAAMKPVETGVTPGTPTDASLLHAAAGGEDAPSDVCPVAFTEPLAPLVAAQRAARPVDLEALDAAFGRLIARRDAVVVEGAGGLLVPLTERVSCAGLFARWRLGLVVVAANRLGAINHVLLTVQAARAAQLPIRGVVLNNPTSAPPDAATDTNPRTLAQLLPGIPVLTWPWLTDVRDAVALAARAEQLGLGVLIDGPVPTPRYLNRTEQTT
jgi:dethiobiotin synthetase